MKMPGFYFLYILIHLHGCLGVCPRRCSCDSTRSVQCYRITEVPPGIPSATRRLYISHSKIKQLQVSDISGIAGLEELILFSSGIEVVENSSLQALSHLKILELQKNKLRQIPGFLPACLEVLKLSDNVIHSIYRSDFEGLPKLRVLEIQNNLISALRSSIFSTLFNLQSLILDGNGLESVSGPFQLPHLKHLSLENNKLHAFPESFFAPLHSLQFLSLAGNLLTKVPPQLPRSLLSLKLERNQIKSVRLADMRHLENLMELFLSANQLSSMDGAHVLSNVTTLEISRNHLKAIPLRLPRRLQKLDCSNNLIPKVTGLDFQGLQDLKHLFLDNNALSFFEDGALQKCVQLSNLALEQNLLTAIPLRLPDTLARLDLKGNSIEDIREQELKGLKQLQVLNLRNNRISAIDGKVLECLPRLRHLYLDGNPWNCTCDLLRVKKLLKEMGTDVKSGQCVEPVESQGESWMSSRKILQHCEDDPYASDSKDIQKSAKPDEQASLKAQVDDDDYDYEVD
ncbi:nephrocan-like [Rhinatrema bivittatum]|uniref:nephrocan-like n=1 Tax=Rhinatrema bivittatum TaxID=194408 RepID=UPI001128445B|nr:nephrocan-like [Rhinatrema bivittatum]